MTGTKTPLDSKTGIPTLWGKLGSQDHRNWQPHAQVSNTKRAGRGIVRAGCQWEGCRACRRSHRQHGVGPGQSPPTHTPLPPSPTHRLPFPEAGVCPQHPRPDIRQRLFPEVRTWLHNPGHHGGNLGTSHKDGAFSDPQGPLPRWKDIQQVPALLWPLGGPPPPACGSALSLCSGTFQMQTQWLREGPELMSSSNSYRPQPLLHGAPSRCPPGGGGFGAWGVCRLSDAPSV